MLQTIRDRIQGPVIIGILGLLALVFVIWGIGARQFFGDSQDPVVAEVGDTKITLAQFHQEYDRAYQQLVEMQGENFRPDSLDTAKFRKNVLDGLVGRDVLSQYARKLGYRASDAQVFDELSRQPSLQQNGAFSVETYRALLKMRGQTPEQFEDRLRRDLSAQQVRQGVEETAFVTPRQVEVELAADHQPRTYRSVHLDPSTEPVVAPTPDEIQKYYDAHKEDFRTPQKIRVAYVELALDKMPPAAAPSAAALHDLYDKQLKGGAFTTPEERHAAHIIIKFGADKAASRKTADTVSQQAKSGGDFAALAKQYSEDGSTKDKGGDLGWNPRKTFSPELEQALFSLKVGEVSAPVETPSGWDVVKVLDVHPEKVQPFEDAEVQKTLADSYQKMDAGKRFQDGHDRISDLAFENPSSLDALSKTLALPVQNSDWFTAQGGSGIASNADVVKAAFTPDVIQDGDNSKPIALSPKDLVVLRKLDVAPPRLPAIGEVTDQIKTRLQAQHASDAVLAKAKQVKDGLAAGRPIDDVAAAVKTTALASRTVTRADIPAGSKFSDVLFALAPPQGQKPSVGEADGQAGVVDIIQLTAVGQPQLPAAASTDGRAAAQTLRERLAGETFDGYRSVMEKKVGVKVTAPPAGSESNPLE